MNSPSIPYEQFNVELNKTYLSEPNKLTCYSIAIDGFDEIVDEQRETICQLIGHFSDGAHEVKRIVLASRAELHLVEFNENDKADLLN